MIDWQPMATAPRDRELLLAEANHLGTAYGGDGVKLHPKWPYLFYIAHWHDGSGSWMVQSHGDEELTLDPDEPCAWAEITPPDMAKIGA